MAMKIDFDWKKFLMEKGEKIGFGVGVAVLGLMAVVGLKGAFSASPTTNADNLNKKTAVANDKLKNNKPSNMEQFKVPEELMNTAASLTPIRPDPDLRAVASLYVPFAPADPKRREPKIESPTEMVVAVLEVQAKAYMFSSDGKEVMTIKGEGVQGDKNALSGAAKRMNDPSFKTLNAGPRGGAGAGGMIQPPQGVGFGPGIRGQNPGRGGGQPRRVMDQVIGREQKMGGAAGEASKDRSQAWVAIDKLSDQSSVQLADQVMPIHMVLWQGAFPYRKQLEDIMSAIHSPTLSDAAHELHFAGFEVQRREIGPDGKRSEWGECGERGFAASVRDVVRKTGKRFAKEDPSMEALILHGLVYGLPEQFDERPYPPVTINELEEAKKAIESKGQSLAAAQEPGVFDVDEGQEFVGGGSGQGAKATETGNVKSPTGSTPKTGAAPKTGVKPGAGDAGELNPRGGAKNVKVGGAEGTAASSTSNANWEPPEYCLIRFFDPVAEPGKTYEYRFKVKIKNPNKDKKDVAYEKLASKQYVESNWIELPQRVTIPPDFRFYAVNVKELAAKDAPGEDLKVYKGGAYRIPGDNQLAVQLQRWVEIYDPAGTKEPVGDWAVAEQVIFQRGEFIGGIQRIQMPIWNWLNHEFVIATHTKERNQKTALVPFTDSDSQCPMLVDFSPAALSYHKPDETRKVIVDDKDLPREVLLLSPEGRLFVRNSAIDGADKDRKEHVVLWRDRVKDIREREKAQKQKPGTEGKDTSPFNKSGAPGKQ
jgi:hypothetical protein